MSTLKREKKNVNSESPRPTTTSDKPIDRRRFLFLFGAGVLATGLFGTKAFAGEEPIIVASADIESPTEKSIGAKGVGEVKETNKSGYKLVIDAPSNCFVGDAILLSVVNDKGEIGRGQKVEVTDPSGNTFMVSVDNAQNGFVARTEGTYTIKHGSEKIFIVVREMDAEIGKLQAVSADEVRGLVEKTEHVWKGRFELKNDGTLKIYNEDGTLFHQVNISRLKELNYKLNGTSLKITMGSDIVKQPKGGELLQILIPAAASTQEIEKNQVMAIIEILVTPNKAVAYEPAYLRLN